MVDNCNWIVFSVRAVLHMTTIKLNMAKLLIKKIGPFADADLEVVRNGVLEYIGFVGGSEVGEAIQDPIGPTLTDKQALRLLENNYRYNPNCRTVTLGLTNHQLFCDYLDKNIGGTTAMCKVVIDIFSAATKFQTDQKATSHDHSLERLVKVAIHEVIHTMFMWHCDISKTCIMQNSAGSVEAYDRMTGLCYSCRDKVERKSEAWGMYFKGNRVWT